MADLEKIESGTGVRARYRDLEPGASDADPNKAFAKYGSAAPVTPLGHTRQTFTTTPAVISSVPSQTKRIHIYNLSADTDVYFTDYTGQEPGPTLGFPIRADSWFMYDSEPTADLKLATVSGTASLAFAFYA